MTTLEDAPVPGPMPRMAKNAMLAGLFIATPGIGLLAGRMLGSSEYPLSTVEQYTYTADIGIGAAVALIAFLAGVLHTRQGR